VNYYDTPTPLQQLAKPQHTGKPSIAIHPWDPKVIPDMKNDSESDLGLTPMNDAR